MVAPKRSDRLIDLAVSPLDEEFKSLVGQPSGDGGAVQLPLRRTLFLTHEITEYTALAFDSLMQQLCSADEAPIYIIFNCAGGNTLDGFGMHDVIKGAEDAGSPTTGIVRGTAMSMAPVVLQACKTRRMTANSYMMLHKGWGDLFGNTSEVERSVKWWRNMEDRCNRILASRSSLTLKEIQERIAEGDWYLTSKEALKFGLVDEVI